MSKEHLETFGVIVLSLVVAEIWVTPMLAGILNPILTPIGVAYA